MCRENFIIYLNSISLHSCKQRNSESFSFFFKSRLIKILIFLPKLPKDYYRRSGRKFFLHFVLEQSHWIRFSRYVEEEEFVSLKIQKLIGKKIKKTIEKLVLRSTGATRSIKLGHCSDPEDDVAGKLSGSICNYIFFNVKWDTRWGEKIKFGVSLCHFFLRATVCQILSLHAARESKKRGASSTWADGQWWLKIGYLKMTPFCETYTLCLHFAGIDTFHSKNR